MLLSLLPLLMASNNAISQERPGRIIPPAVLKCDRSDLTLYDGKVITYRRRKGSTLLRIRTSFETTEVVILRHAGTDDPSKLYLLNGQPFAKSDWRRIEKRKGILRSGLIANAWVCRGNPSIQPLIDWRTNDAGSDVRGD
jgi:hypothetical protein